MGASRFIGRVGGLAVSLGVGAAVFGSGTAWADDTTTDDPGTPSVGTSSATTTSPSHRGTHAAARANAPTKPAASARTARQAPAAATPAAARRASNAAAAKAVAPESTPRANSVAVIEPATPVEADLPTAPDAISATEPAPEPLTFASVDTPPVEVAAPEAAAPDVVTTAEDLLGSSAGTDPFAPTESPLAWGVLAAVRRHTSGGAASTTAAAATATSASLLGGGSLTSTPTVIWKDGILIGNTNTTSAKGLPIGYSAVSKPSQGGKLGGGPLLPLTNFAPNGNFTYVPYASVLTDGTQTESFKIMAFEITKFDQRIAGLFGAAGPLLVEKLLGVIHRIPLVGTLLSPLIGSSQVVKFTENPFNIANGRPTDFTYKMASFDGTLISVNYFPAINVANGLVDEAPTVLAASGLACAANTDPTTVYGQLFPSNQFGSLTPGIAPLRSDSYTSPLIGGPSYNGGGGYNVITWDPRGEFASQGQLQIDNPMYEGRDTSAIISWLNSSLNPAQDQIQTNAGDPLVGITGGSYGGGIQLTTVDPRIDGLIPEISWNSLISSLYPNQNQFKTGWGTILVAALAFTGARINPAIYAGILTGALTGKMTPGQQAVIGSVGPTTLLTKATAPTLMMQGIDDTLFLLQEAVDAGQTITSNTNVPFKQFWFCGGHGTCSIPDKPFAQDGVGVIQNLQWLDQYVAGNPLKPADDIPNFQWYDQDGIYGSSALQPFDPGFNPHPSDTTTGTGGFLGIWPFLGGSNAKAGLPFSITNAAKARNAINVAVTPDLGDQIVGSPTLSFSYKGLGTSRTVYAQLVDNTTGLVLSNNSTPIPVVLNGQDQTVEIPMANIVYTARPGDSLTLQITSSALNYENFLSYGFINISDIKVSLPVHATNVS